MILAPHRSAAIPWMAGARAAAIGAIAVLAMGIPAAGAAERVARPRLCPEDAPEGVRLPSRPDCGSGIRRGEPEDMRGFRDVGGVTLRIGGRVGAEYGIGR